METRSIAPLCRRALSRDATPADFELWSCSAFVYALVYAQCTCYVLRANQRSSKTGLSQSSRTYCPWGELYNLWNLKTFAKPCIDSPTAAAVPFSAPFPRKSGTWTRFKRGRILERDSAEYRLPLSQIDWTLIIGRPLFQPQSDWKWVFLSIHISECIWRANNARFCSKKTSMIVTTVSTEAWRSRFQANRVAASKSLDIIFTKMHFFCPCESQFMGCYVAVVFHK